MSAASHDCPATPALKARIFRAATLKVVGNQSDVEIAKELNISVHTLADWKKRIEWREATNSCCDEAWSEAVLALRTLNRKAVTVLYEAMDDENPKIRIAAAKVALGHGLVGIL